MTLLDAVNLCLRSTGETGVASLNSNHPKFATILAGIDTISKRAQRKSWWFNSGVRDLVPETSGPNTGKIVTTAYDLVESIYRYQNFYPVNGILIDGFDGTPVSIGVRAFVRWIAPTTENGWLNLPESFIDYVATSAALDYASNYDADQLQLQKLITQQRAALTAVNADDIRYKNVNLFQSGSAGIAIQRAWGSRYNRLYR
jgi:hypothetical protein